MSGRAWCPRFSCTAALLLFKADHLLWYSETPHTHLPLHMKHGAQATLFPSQMQIVKKTPKKRLSILRERDFMRTHSMYALP